MEQNQPEEIWFVMWLGMRKERGWKMPDPQAF